MKYTEFDKEVYRLGFKTYRANGQLYVAFQSGTSILTVSTTDTGVIDTNFSGFRDKLSGSDKQILLDIAYQLTRTFLDQREEEDKYYLKTASSLVPEDIAYLNLDYCSGDYFWNDSYYSFGIQTIFTQTEVDNMDTTGLIPIPVDKEET